MPDDNMRFLLERPWAVSAKAGAGGKSVEPNYDGNVLYIEGDRHLLLDGSGKVVDQGRFAALGGKRVRLRTPQGLMELEAVELSANGAVFQGNMTISGASLPLTIKLTPSSAPFRVPAPATLHEAAALGDVKAIRQMLAAGAKIDEMKDGTSPLMLAAYRCHPSAVERLLEAGARTNLVSDNGKSALIVAVESGDAEVVRALLAKKADVGFRRAADKASSIVIAVGDGNLEVARALVEGGADLQDRDQYGIPLLCIAASGDLGPRHELLDVVRFLLEKKVDPNQRGEDGLTPLLRAAMGDLPETVGLLLDHGADPKGTDGQGRTLAEYAVNSPAVRKLLAARRI